MADATSNIDSVGNPTAASANSNLIIINPANQINSVKLSDDNFLLWQLQVLAGVKGLGLEVFIFANPPVPPNIIPEDGSNETINPLFITWCRQDQLLFSFLLAYMTEAVQAQMIGCITSSQLWTRVSQLFANRSKAHVMQYKLQLQTLKKGTLSMKDYLSKMKGYMDLLAVCGHPIADNDQILYVLGGVGLEYDSVVVHVTSRVDTLSFPEVGALLLSHEGRLDAYNLNANNTPNSINAATLFHQKKPETQQSYQNSRGSGRGRNFRGGRRVWQNNNGCSVCQICGVPGHVAEICYYRFEKDFVPKSRQPSQSLNRTHPSI